MKKILLSTIVLFLLFSVPAFAAESKPIDITVWKNVQIYSPETSIKGVRLNFLYGVNKNLTGVDLGLLLPFNVLEGNLKGVQFGIYNGVKGNAEGVQFGIVNFVGHDFSGWQESLANVVEGKCVGFQNALFNSAHSMKGLQLGIWNQADNLKGLQIGLINLNKSGQSVFSSARAPYFFPIVNWAF